MNWMRARLLIPMGASAVLLPLLLGYTLSPQEVPSSSPAPPLESGILESQVYGPPLPEVLDPQVSQQPTDDSPEAEPNLEHHRTGSAAPTEEDTKVATPVELPAPEVQRLAEIPVASESLEMPALTIRVAVLTETDTMTVGSSTPGAVTDDTGQVVGTIEAGSGAIARPAQQGIQVNSWQAPAAVWIQPADNGLVFVGDRWYRGQVRLIREEQKLTAVNYVDFEHYLYSVVGSEMPASWPLEALKAQAIAARSYALVHLYRPANLYYDLGASERHQVYQGVVNEYNSTQQAVYETTGRVLSYQGALVESLYAANAAIATEAHGHLGASMSQQGAYQLASRGYNHLQILGAYYPGVQLAQLRAQG